MQVQRCDAAEEAEDEYDVKADLLRKSTAGNQSRSDKEFLTKGGRAAWVETATLKKRDKVFENALQTMVQMMMYRIYDQDVKFERIGAREKDLEILTLFFAGSNKPKYAREMLHYQIDRHVCWTDEHAYMELNNCLVNESGRAGAFRGRDNTCEHINLEVQATVDMRDSGQSRKYKRETVAPNFFVYRALRKSFPSAIGTRRGGDKHSYVSDRRDIEDVVAALGNDSVLKRIEGRCVVHVGTALVEIQEVQDPFAVGGLNILKGNILHGILEKRKGKVQYADPPEPDLII